MMGIEVGAATEDGVVLCDFGDGGEERGICGARVDGAGVYIVAGVYVGRGGDASRGFGV